LAAAASPPASAATKAARTEPGSWFRKPHIEFPFELPPVEPELLPARPKLDPWLVLELYQRIDPIVARVNRFEFGAEVKTPRIMQEKIKSKTIEPPATVTIDDVKRRLSLYKRMVDIVFHPDHSIYERGLTRGDNEQYRKLNAAE
jgi:hypothetical protein